MVSESMEASLLLCSSPSTHQMALSALFLQCRCFIQQFLALPPPSCKVTPTFLGVCYSHISLFRYQFLSSPFVLHAPIACNLGNHREHITFLKLGRLPSPRSRHWQGLCLMRAPYPLPRWSLECCVPVAGRSTLLSQGRETKAEKD